MDLRQLQTIVAIADAGSLAGAAAIVNLTPSAVSQQIQALEAHIGVELIDRKKRPRQLNARGQEVVRTARDVVQKMAEVQMVVSGRKTAGVLKFGAIRTVSMQLVPSAFAKMRPLYPDLSFELTVGMSQTLMSDVAAGRLDAAMVAEHLGVPSGLTWSTVLTEPLVLLAPAQERSRSELSLLRDLPFIRYETDVPLARQIETELSRLNITPKQIVVTNTMPSVVGMVESGLGVSIVPKIVTLDMRADKLFTIPFCDDAIYRQIGLVQRQVSSRSAVLADLQNALTEHAALFGLHVN